MKTQMIKEMVVQYSLIESAVKGGLGPDMLILQCINFNSKSYFYTKLYVNAHWHAIHTDEQPEHYWKGKSEKVYVLG